MKNTMLFLFSFVCMTTVAMEQSTKKHPILMQPLRQLLVPRLSLPNTAQAIPQRTCSHNHQEAPAEKSAEQQEQPEIWLRDCNKIKFTFGAL
jgi:hypothetical protein